MGASRNASAIECPKCAAPAQENAIECARCGIVLAKFEQRAVADPVVSPPFLEESSPTVHDDPLQAIGRLARAAVLVGLIVWTWQFARGGQNLLDLAPYIADARALQLVLLGGKTGAEVEGHDWEYLLTGLGWLPYDRTLGLWAYRVGLMMMTGATVWGAMLLAKRRAAPAEGSDGL